MLILNRKVGEQIRIGDEVLLTVLEIGRGQIKLGVEAPRHVAIHRGEVYDRIREENRAAALGGQAVNLAGLAGRFQASPAPAASAAPAPRPSPDKEQE